MANVSMTLAALATTFLLAGCQSIPQTSIAATEKTIATGVCTVWKPITYSSRDTSETQLEARANNAARDTYCGS